jgi:hypothetical protein
MNIELTPNRKDWISWDNSLFHKGDIIITHETIHYHKDSSNQVLAEIGDELIVVIADCIGCFVQNKTHPELNLKAPENCPEDMIGLYDCWMLTDIRATLIKTP